MLSRLTKRELEEMGYAIGREIVAYDKFLTLYRAFGTDLNAKYKQLRILTLDPTLKQLLEGLGAAAVAYEKYIDNPSEETKAAANDLVLALSKKDNLFLKKLTTTFPPNVKTPSLQPVRDALAELERLGFQIDTDPALHELKAMKADIVQLADDRSAYIRYKNALMGRAKIISSSIQNLIAGLIQANTELAPTIQSQLEQELKQMEAERGELAAVQNAPALNEANLNQLRTRIQQNGSVPQGGPIPSAQINTLPSASPSSNRTGQTPPPVQPAASSSSSSAVVLVAVGGAAQQNSDNAPRSRNNTPPSREHTPPSKKNQVVPAAIQLDIVPPADPHARASHQGLNGKRELEEQQRIAAEAPAKKPVQKKWYHCCS